MKQQTNTWQKTFIVCFFVLLVAPVAAYAEGENHDPSHNHKAEMAQDDGENHSTHHHETGGTEDSATTPSSQERQPVNLIAPSGHHHRHRPPLLPPDQDQAYSELNHHIAGVFVFLAGGISAIGISRQVSGFPGHGLGGLASFFCLACFCWFVTIQSHGPWGRYHFRKV